VRFTKIVYEVHYFCPSLSSILCEMCSHLLELRRNAGHTFPCLLPQPVHLPPAESDSQPFISICVFINPSERSGLGYTNQFSLIVTAKFYFLQCWSEPLLSVPDLPPQTGGDLQSQKCQCLLLLLSLCSYGCFHGTFHGT